MAEEKKEKSGLTKNLVINRHTVWTVPNILVFFRILCVPIYMTLLILGANPGYLHLHQVYPSWYVYVALAILAIAAFSDVLDGKIARKYKAGTKMFGKVLKYDQGTYVGQCIDPIADKVMHIGVITALALAQYIHWAFIILLVFRELMMVVIGSFLVNDINIKANMLGKVASAIISCGAILCFFHAILWANPDFFGSWNVMTIDWIVVTIGLALNWAAAINYAVDASRQMKEHKRKLAEAETAEEETPAEESATENTEEPVVEEKEETKE